MAFVGKSNANWPIIGVEVDMNWKIFIGTFIVVFLAELGDKTQLATLSFAMSATSRWMVFAGASAALICTSGLAVVSAEVINRWISPSLVRWVSGGVFIIIGAWMIFTNPK